jgi:GR25 family glycosyltransferase involved in LPS biosynthesis
MTTIRIGVVAHILRQSYAQQLADQVDAATISFDDGMLGVNKNHIKVWTNLLQQGGDWLVVLEDDAVPVDDFRYHLTQALINAPTDIVSLYLGTGYPKAWQRFIKTAMADKSDANYIVSTHLLHAVGTAIKVDLVNDMLRFISWMSEGERKWPIDEQITHWARMRGHKISYARPSLVDHMDGPTTVHHPDGQSRDGVKRRAWEVGTRDLWHRSKVIEMP